MATSRPNTIELIKSLSQFPSDMKSAGAGLAATSQMIGQATKKATPPAPMSGTTPQDLSKSQGPYGSRPGETRLDSNGDPISGLSGVKRK